MSSAVVYDGAKILKGKRHLLFTVALGNGKRVHMSVMPAKYGITGDRVVVVRADKFVELWRSDPRDSNRTLSYGNAESWRQYYKYQRAAEGFARGASDPVPLAEVSCEVDSQTPNQSSADAYALFSNGITRTVWLLSHGCDAFPVLSPPPDAELLHERAGLSEYTFQQLSSLPVGSDL